MEAQAEATAEVEGGVSDADGCVATDFAVAVEAVAVEAAAAFAILLRVVAVAIVVAVVAAVEVAQNSRL